MKYIGIKLADGSFYTIMEEGKPATKVLDITTASDNQSKVQVDLYRSATQSMADAEYVDTVELANLQPHPNGEPCYQLKLSLDQNNKLNAEVNDPETGASSTSNVTLLSQTMAERTGDPTFLDIDSSGETLSIVDGPEQSFEEPVQELDLNLDEELPDFDQNTIDVPVADDSDSFFADESSSLSMEELNNLESFADKSTEEDMIAPVSNDDDFSFDDITRENKPKAEETPADSTISFEETEFDLPQEEPVEQSADVISEENSLNDFDSIVGDINDMPDIDSQPIEASLPGANPLDFVKEPVDPPDRSDITEETAASDDPFGGLGDFDDDITTSNDIPDTSVLDESTGIGDNSGDLDLPDFESEDTEINSEIPDIDNFNSFDSTSDSQENTIEEQSSPDITFEETSPNFSDFESAVMADTINNPEQENALDADFVNEHTDPTFDDEMDFTSSSDDPFAGTDDFSGSSIGAASGFAAGSTDETMNEDPFADDIFAEEPDVVSDRQENDSAKKTKGPVIVCVICAIICVLATLLLLFVIPNKYNLFNKNESSEQIIAEQEEKLPAVEDNVVIAEEPEEIVPVKPVKSESAPKDIQYKIKWGDTLWDIADAYYKNPWKYKQIAKYNNIANPDKIVSGTIISIPSN